MDVRLEIGEQRRGGVPREDHHEVDRLQRRQQLGPLGGGDHGPAWAFQARDRGIVVDPHHQGVPLGAGVAEIAQVPHVEQIEMAVGEGDLLPRGLERPDALAQLGDGQDQPHRISSSGRGSLSTARRSSSGEQVAVPIFITTTPPA